MAERDAKGRFLPGHSFGRGRPQGSRNKATLALDEIGEKIAPAVLGEVAAAAVRRGDMQAAALILARVWPVRRGGRPITDFKLPAIDTADDAVKACAEILRGVTDGRLTVDEGEALSRIVDTQRAALEHRDLERRLVEVEERELQRRQHHAPT